jgi:hypothetical protein
VKRDGLSPSANEAINLYKERDKNMLTALD